MASEMFFGSPILLGDNTVPGVKYPPELEAEIPRVVKACHDFGIEPYPSIVELLTYDEISEVAAYGGFPVRYPHWSFGMEYEELSKGYEHGMHKIYEMVINCLEPTAPVLTSRGTINADRVKVGDEVFGNNGRRKVVAVKRQAQGETVKISLYKHGRPLTCSPGHKWRVLTTNGPAWIEAKDLKNGDLLLGADAFEAWKNSPAVLGWNADKVLEETRPNVRHRVKEINAPAAMTLPLAAILGAALGDGSIGVVSKENQVNITVDKNHADYAKRICSLITETFGLEPIVEGDKSDSVDVVTLCSKAAVDFFDFIGVPKGCTYKTKRVPWSIWASSQEYRAAFLQHLMDTDGSSSGTISFSAYNHDFACDVQLLLLEMGIDCTCSRVKNDHNDISVVRVQGRDSVQKFQDRVGFILPHKQEWLKSLLDTANCSGGGAPVPFFQNEAIRIATESKMNSYNEKSLGVTLNKMKKGPLGFNAVYRFVERSLEAGYRDFEPLLKAMQVPIFEVTEVASSDSLETIDIALDHDDHDFVAYGLLSHNTNPSYIYCLDSNPLVDQVTVIAHALFHSDFFRNNVWFEPTTENAMNELADNGTRIQRYISRWGGERVGQFIDWVLSIDDLIDPTAAWHRRVMKDKILSDEKKYHYPRRLGVPSTEGKEHDYMEPWINSKEWRDAEMNRIKELEVRDELGIFERPDRDILGYLVEHAPLNIWQKDIIAMLYREAQYFAPQALTKMANEGWASYGDYNIMARQRWAGNEGIVHYARHKTGVLGGKYSMNPYAVGFKLFQYVEDKWNKGRFGREYDECDDVQKKENWDMKLGLGHEKVFEVRRIHNDVTMIHAFLDQEFVDKYELYIWKKYPLPDGGFEYRIESRDAGVIKKMLMDRYRNGGRPDIRLADPNYGGKKILLMQHQWDGRPLHPKQTQHTLISTWNIWNNAGTASKNAVALASRDKDENEIVYVCTGSKPENSVVMKRKMFEETFA